MRNYGWMAAVACGIAALAAPARGALVTWMFEGEVTYFTDSHAVLDGSVFLGAPLSGVIVYDSELADRAPGNPAVGDYLQDGSPGVFSVQVGNYELSVPSFRIIVYDDFMIPAQPPFDALDFNITELIAFPGVTGTSISQFDLGPYGIDLMTLTSDALPPAPLPQANFESNSLAFILLGCLDGEIVSSACSTSSIEISAHVNLVPEPRAEAGGWLAAFALASLAAVRSAAHRSAGRSAAAVRASSPLDEV